MSHPIPRILALAISALALLAPRPARAQTCNFTAGPTLISFGIYNAALGTPTDSTGTFRFRCVPGSTSANVYLSAGAGSFAQRQLVKGADRMDYNLYQDAPRSLIWGDGTPPSTFLAGARTGRYTVYARAPAGQWVAAGDYADTITITLLY